MSIDPKSVKSRLVAFDLPALFTQELGWDKPISHGFPVELEGKSFDVVVLAEKKGVQACWCVFPEGDKIPERALLRRLAAKIRRQAHENLIVFSDFNRTIQIWCWSQKEEGKSLDVKFHSWYKGQTGDALSQRFAYLAVSLDEEEEISTTKVTAKMRKAFNVEQVTKKFYERFAKEHDAFLKFLEGVPDKDLERWYVSVMLNRLMFVYFIQKKGFLDGDTDYLRNRLALFTEKGKDRYYRDFLCPLFFEGFAKQESERSDKVRKLLGKIPYLNGGIFQQHQIEKLYGKEIEIPDRAFVKLFDFFDSYKWHLDERPLKKDDEINPDVLGYIFEKYINQKQMGAYYTKEDITGYISKNTILPHLFDSAKEKCKTSFEGARSVWSLLAQDPDSYIYNAVRHGVIGPDGMIVPESELPDFVQSGMHNPKLRMHDNRYNLQQASAEDPLRLVTETWREYIHRRNRCLEIREKMLKGEIREINDLITYNLDIREFAKDVIETAEGPDLVSAFWHFLEKLTVLDPTCGSGAFLFAALNILEPLYEACLERMRFFIQKWEAEGKKNHPNYHKAFTETLRRVSDHHNTKYFIYKTVIINNLYGVDIMEEAVEICKLRLFLKLVAQVERVEDVEPLPDIDFNILAGNTLVGFVSLEQVVKTQEGTFNFGKDGVKRIENAAKEVDELFALFRAQQTKLGGEVLLDDKETLRSKLKALTDELDIFLAKEYGRELKKKNEYNQWKKIHQPFHWFAEFYGILSGGGFDVIIGNPPYVDIKKIDYCFKGTNYISGNNLYALVLERALSLLISKGRAGMIVPISMVSGKEYTPLAKMYFSLTSWVSSYSNRPGKLFAGVEQRLTIIALQKQSGSVFSSRYFHWYSNERNDLFQRISYIPTQLTHDYRMPIKMGTACDASIISKILKKELKIQSLAGTSRQECWFHDGPTYWIRALPFKPSRNQSDRSSHYHAIRGTSDNHALAISIILSSSIFYFVYKSISNCRDFGESEIDFFRIGKFSSSEISKISNLALIYSDCLKKNAKHCTRNYPSGIVKYDEFYPSNAKEILDQGDSILAHHYNLSIEEQDYLINYDIKYRMGAEFLDDDSEE